MVPEKVPIEKFGHKVENRVFCFFVLVLIVLHLTGPLLQEILGPDRLTGAIETARNNWSKFAAESAYLQAKSSGFLLTYQLAQIVFPILSLGLLPFLYWLILTRSHYLDSEKYVWRTEALLYILVVCAFLIGFVVFYEFTPQPGSFYRRLYEFPWFFAFLPLYYTATTSLILRIWVVMTALLVKLARTNRGK